MSNDRLEEKIPFWKDVMRHVKVGDLIQGKVSAQQPWGTYVRFEKEGVPAPMEGLVTLPYTHDDPDEMVSTRDQLVLGQEVAAAVMSVDPRGGVMLSLRQSHLDYPERLLKAE
jgi:predicted RNA-binding protein with RPS1 domain